MNETTLFIGIGLAVVLLSIAIFDVYIIMKKGKYESISAHIIRGAKTYSSFVIPFACLFGFVCGHLFWSMDTFDYADKETLTKKCKEFLLKENK